MTGPQSKSLGYVRVYTPEQALCGLSLEARKRKVNLYAPATAPPLASKAFTSSLASSACAALEARKAEHEEDRTH